MPYATRSCVECAEQFKPTSRHVACPKCRYKAKLKFCECGNTRHPNALRCQACRIGAGVDIGPNNGNWRGGLTKPKSGYIQVRAYGRPNSPPYVFEHVLVMESVLGRMLLPGENVHHINGVKDDNRPENLELWVTSQPRGQRVEDLVEWAQEILRRYGG